MNLKKQRPRRSEMRLGKRMINYQTAAWRPRLALTPTLDFLQQQGHKVVAVSGLLLLSWVLYLLFTTPLFFVYGAEIKGNTVVTKQEIYQASGVDSQSIFWLDAAKIAQSVQSNPNIKAVSVQVALPANVGISVVERTPELLWQTGNTVWWVDEEGVIVPPKGDTSAMLKIVDDDQQPLEVGYQVDLTIIRGAQMLQMLVPGLTSIHHSRARGLTVATPEGWPVYLGDGGEMRQKLYSLTALLEHLRSEGVEPLYIELHDPRRPVYRDVPNVPIPQPVSPPPQPTYPPQPPSNAPQSFSQPPQHSNSVYYQP